MKTLRFLVTMSLLSFLTPSQGAAEEEAENVPVFSMQDSTKIEQKIRNALGGACRARIIFQDNTLREAFQYLSDVHDIPIYPVSLEEFDIDLDQTRITFEMKECTLEDALTMLCRKASLAFIIEDSLLKIVPEKVAAARFETVVYDLGAFADLGYPTDDLSSVLRKTVAPGSWVTEDSSAIRLRNANFSADGESTHAAAKPERLHLAKGAIEPISGGIVVYQSQPVHREIQRALQQLWGVAKRHQEAEASSDPPTYENDPKQDS